jgi:ADP-ribose pyrophosphatase
MTQDTIHYQGNYLSLLERNGWEFTSRPNATGVVVIIAVTDANEIVLVEQFRPPVGTSVIELPAGLVGDDFDKNESKLAAAGRELEEETGYVAANLEVFMEAPSSAGMTDEIVTFVWARNLRRTGPGGGIDNEDIRVHTIPIQEVDDWLQKQSQTGKLLDPKIFSALHWISRSQLNT